MPRPAQSSQEKATAKKKILKKAVELINAEGFENFNMRRLGDHLGIAAKTIYNYYHNKDELYLTILAHGFRNLYERCRKACHGREDPLERLEAMGRAYVEFGLTRSHYYNLMFTWNVPKYDDYANTPFEALARVELNASLRLYELFVNAVQSLAPDMSDADARFYVIWFWSLAHGYLSGCNNRLLYYMHPDPLLLKERILGMLMDHIHNEIKYKTNGGEQAWQP